VKKGLKEDQKAHLMGMVNQAGTKAHTVRNNRDRVEGRPKSEKVDHQERRQKRGGVRVLASTGSHLSNRKGLGGESHRVKKGKKKRGKGQREGGKKRVD